MLKAFVNFNPLHFVRQKRDSRVGQRPGRASLDYITGYGKPCVSTTRTNTVTIEATAPKGKTYGAQVVHRLLKAGRCGGTRIRPLAEYAEPLTAIRNLCS